MKTKSKNALSLSLASVIACAGLLTGCADDPEADSGVGTDQSSGTTQSMEGEYPSNGQAESTGQSQSQMAAQSQSASANQNGEAQIATVNLNPTEGNDVIGVVTFVQDGDQVHVTGRVENLEPGEHGFHVHENGDCSAPDATSAGGHYNPEGTDHGSRTGEGPRHVGDFGNITADSEGVAQINFVDEKISLQGEHSIIGKALIVHGGEDDLSSQPSGDAGPRVACGVIEADEV